ncbi:MAG: MerR family transcriptional regulator [Lachnospiraceae bacterium]|nr:MerR family transcriptional regulator [Lachnospiraceae bacterium]MBP3610588.1 MerR family transcriptional regulator [Lachnospiraceae bacterium]
MKTYTIRELSQLTNTPASALRYYEDIGLLTNVAREGSKRIYNDFHLARLHAIQCFKNTGMSIAKMQDFFRYEENIPEHIDAIIQLVTEHEADIEKQIAILQKELSHIQHKVRFYNGIKKAITEDRCWPEWEEV